MTCAPAVRIFPSGPRLRTAPIEVKPFNSSQRNDGFIVLKWNFTLTERCKVKGQIRAWLFSEKGEYSRVFVEKICWLAFFELLFSY